MIGIIYLDKNGFTLYDSKTKGISQFNFKPEVAKDLEIISIDQLNLQIKSYVEANKITPGGLVMVISHNMLFEKDFAPLSKEQQEIETKKFLDNIPFENVSSKTFQLEKGHRVVAANSHFFESVKNAFEVLGFIVVTAIPSVAFGNFGESLNLEASKLILSKFVSLKQYNFLQDGQATNTSLSQQDTGEEKDVKTNNVKNNKKNLIAIGIFVFLIVILSIIVFIFLSSQKSSGKAVIKSTSDGGPKGLLRGEVS